MVKSRKLGRLATILAGIGLASSGCINTKIALGSAYKTLATHPRAVQNNPAAARLTYGIGESLIQQGAAEESRSNVTIVLRDNNSNSGNSGAVEPRSYVPVIFNHDSWRKADDGDRIIDYSEIANISRKVFTTSEKISISAWVNGPSVPASSYSLKMDDGWRRNNSCWTFQPGDFSVGKHNIVWYVNGKPVVTDSFEVVKSADSNKAPEEKKSTEPEVF